MDIHVDICGIFGNPFGTLYILGPGMWFREPYFQLDSNIVGVPDFR